MSSKASCFAGDLFRRPLRNDPAAARSAFGAKVDHPISALDDIEIVLDNNNRIAAINKPLKHFQKHVDIGKMQTGRRLVKQVQRPARIALAKLRGQLDTLGFTAGQRRCRLSKFEITQTNFLEDDKFLVEPRNIFEEFYSFFDCHF